MCPKFVPPELLFEIALFVPAECAVPNVLPSCWMLHNFLSSRVEKWREMATASSSATDCMPPLAASAALCDFQIPTAYQEFVLADSGVYKEKTLAGDQRILIFGRASYAKWCDQMQEIYADGTFDIFQPFTHCQLYVFMSRHGEGVFPVCYVLLTAKTQETYERMFDLLQQRWPAFKPRTASIDCEEGMACAMRSRHSQCSLHFGLFHVVRSMKRQLDEKNLLQMYKTDPEFAETARTITALAFVPVGDLVQALAALETFLPDSLQDVLDWFVCKYIGRLRFDGSRSQPTFPPEQWSVHKRVIEHNDWANNKVITFHRLVQESLSTERFSQTLRRFVNMEDKEFVRCVSGEPPARKRKRMNAADERIVRLVQNYVGGSTDDNVARPPKNPKAIFEFLIEMSRNYGAEL